MSFCPGGSFVPSCFATGTVHSLPAQVPFLVIIIIPALIARMISWIDLRHLAGWESVIHCVLVELLNDLLLILRWWLLSACSRDFSSSLRRTPDSPQFVSNTHDFFVNLKASVNFALIFDDWIWAFSQRQQDDCVDWRHVKLIFIRSYWVRRDDLL